MLPAVAGFDWDDGNRTKCLKHGVSQAEIEFVMRNDPIVAPDARHSVREDRYIAVGRTRDLRVIFVAYTLRSRGGRLLIRPVSARYMHSKEARAYEQARSKAED